MAKQTKDENGWAVLGQVFVGLVGIGIAITVVHFWLFAPYERHKEVMAKLQLMEEQHHALAQGHYEGRAGIDHLRNELSTMKGHK